MTKHRMLQIALLLSAVSLGIPTIAQGDAVLTPLASFDADGQGGPTQSGFASLDADLLTDSAVQNGITLSFTTDAAGKGRDRGASGTLTGHPEADLLRDFVYSSTLLNLDLSGLSSNTRYMARIYSLDRSANNGNIHYLLNGQYATSQTLPGNNSVITAHRTITSSATQSHYDVLVTSGGSGEAHLTMQNRQLPFFNGLQLFEAPDTPNLVARFDVDDINDAQTAPGWTQLTFNDSALTTGAATSNGITVTVTTDRTDSLRNRIGADNMDDVVEDFVFGNATMTVEVAGLTAGSMYEVTVYSQDLDGNLDNFFRWELDPGDASTDVLRAAHYNNESVGAADITFFIEPASSTITLTGEEVNGIIVFNGIEIRAVPEPATLALAALGLGGLRRRRNRA